MNAVIKEVPSIDDIDASMRAFIAERGLERVDPEPTHYHTDELYGRRLIVPTGDRKSTRLNSSH